MTELTNNPYFRALLFIVYGGIGYYVISKWLPNIFIWFLPFILAYYVAYLTQPIVQYLKRKYRMSQKVSAITSLSAFLLIIGSLLGYLITKAITELVHFAREVPTYLSEFPDFYRSVSILLKNYQDKLPFLPGLNEHIESSVGELLTNLSKRILSGTADFASELPSVGLFLAAFLISCFFITIDYEKISGAIKKQLSPPNRERFLEIKGYAVTAVSHYLKGMLLMMLITSAAALAGMLILKIRYSYLIAILLGFLDMLPLIGTGIVLIPWGIIVLLTGNIYKGVGLLALYLVILLVRQLAEPRIMGKALGLHPLATLLAIYIGLKIYGFCGAIIAPILLQICVCVYRSRNEHPKS